MNLKEELRKQIDKIKNFDGFLNENKNNHILLFSDNFYNRYKENINSFKRIYLSKLELFQEYLSNYNLIGVRINDDGVDVYSEAIRIYKKLINGELFVDEVLNDPDNYLRNAIMLLEIDKYKFKKL